VYYQLDRVKLRGEERVEWPAETDPRFYEKVDSLTIRYFFYYRRDFGLAPHMHDLEAIEVEVLLDATPDGCLEVQMRRVTGFAHGNDWYSNELRTETDTRLPITILVEEGKHASCPDRNADGIYTPGYDVNRRTRDAWGVRDVLGSGFMMGSGFNASMAKPRRHVHRMLPPDVDRPCVVPENCSIETSPQSMGRYELRPSYGVGICGVAEWDRLAGMMRKLRFGSEHFPEQYRVEFLRELAEPLTGTHGLIPSVSARWDRAPGVSLTLRGLDLQEAYLVPKINWVGRSVSLEGLVTRSAAQYASWYFSGGLARERVPMRNNGDLDEMSWHLATEVGMKFRARLEGKRRIPALGYEFAGLRVGVRLSGFNEVRLARVVVEVGAGVW
jgi:hypothetical protein